ncbi:MAG: hypothetical protein KDA49_09585 [Rhodospirillaceae bacterium]|nr:hypothetical protein [Rhodospirillaceae bacterium]
MRLSSRMGVACGAVAIAAAIGSGPILRAEAQEPLPELGEVCDRAPTACLLFQDAWATVGEIGRAAGSGGPDPYLERHAQALVAIGLGLSAFGLDEPAGEAVDRAIAMMAADPLGARLTDFRLMLAVGRHTTYGLLDGQGVVTDRFADPSIEWRVLALLAQQQLQFGLDADAAATIQELDETIADIPPNPWPLLVLAELRTRTGRPEEALPLVEAFAANDLDWRDLRSVADAGAGLAEALAAAGRVAEAEHLLELWNDPLDQSILRAGLAAGLAQAGEADAAAEHLATAVGTVTGAEDATPYFAADALVQIGTAYDRAGLGDRAVEVLDLALAEIARTDDFPSVNQVLRHIGQAHLDAGRMDLWQQVLAAHLEAIAGEDNGATQGSALNMIVLAQANAGLFDGAEETIAAIPFDGARTAGLARLAQGLAADGQVEAARQRLLEARALALSMSSGSLQADALLAVVDGQVIAALLAYQDGE